MSTMEPPPLFNTWRPAPSSKSPWLPPSRLWLSLIILVGLVWMLMMPIELPSSNGPALADISRSQCSRSSSSNDLTFLPSSVTVLPSGSFYSHYSELVGTSLGSLVGLMGPPSTSLSIPIRAVGGHLTSADDFPSSLTFHITDLSVQDLDNLLHRFHEIDDVWDSHFLSFVVFAYHDAVDHTEPRLPQGLTDRLQSLGTKRIALVDQSKLELDALTEGPYFATATGLLPVWKLFSDTHAAFVASLFQSPSQTIEYLNATTADAYPNQAIAVPSRLYFPPNPDKPLNGLRVGIKDNIDIAGAKTFASSLAYGEFHGIKSQNAPAIQRLLDLGAVIVSKTGMSQFADAEDPTRDFVDFHAPWNPRGDAIRSPGGSSYGSGAAAGAYDWIDFTIGTDTGGSVRQPAASQSVYGLRPSRGALSVEGTVVIHSDLDAIGVLSRNLSILHTVSYHLYPDKNTKATTDTPPTLIYSSHLFPVEDARAQGIYEKAVQALEKVLGVTRSNVNFHQEWKRSHPDTEAFTEYFEEVFYDYVVWGQWRERSTFRNEYQAKFGRPPYVNPLSRFRWELGGNMTEQHFSKLQYKRQEFQAFIEGIFGDNTIMITPFKFGEPDRRDEYRPEPRLRNKDEFGWGLRPAFQTPMAGQPEIVFPVSQLPVFSSVSQREESYGVIASLIGSQGTDMRIVDITEKLLKELGIPQAVLTGRTPFDMD
ncbi:hypothetical protein FGADI_2732 [Fusarium gaditjirri]|uniref:Amidase domain-containing protein n=1 Tax=Fusarium gaditjirri TaxID=282569 RepID=A0A8H4X0S6_9HYPO|nr:hypothetical protein FGADI_2732 [Fusarium gaditjirri]